MEENKYFNEIMEGLTDILEHEKGNSNLFKHETHCPRAKDGTGFCLCSPEVRRRLSYEIFGHEPNELLDEKKVTEELKQNNISPEVQSNSSFKKFDNGKCDYSLLEPIVVEMYCSVGQMGASKYGRNNWKLSKKEDMHRYEAALLRHLMAYKSGEKKDPESGLSHLSHALWNLVALETKERE